MKTADIVPGVLVAVPWDNSTASSIRSGGAATPARVVAQGKFRYQRQGACGETVIVEDHYTTMVHVKVLDINASFPEWSSRRLMTERANSRWSTAVFSSKYPGFPDGKKLTDKKLVWVDAILSPRMVMMPWGHFLKLREERLMIEIDVSALNAKLEEVNFEISALLELWHVAAPNQKLTWSTQSGQTEALALSPRDGTNDQPFSIKVTTIGVLSTESLPLKRRQLIEPLLRERAAIVAKLTCKT